jgi:integrase
MASTKPLMATLTIRTKTTTRREKRYIVRYRLGGYAYPVVHGGTFRTMKEAKIRRDLIAGEIAAGRNPKLVLAAMSAPAPKVKPLREWATAYLASRVDHADETAKNAKSHMKKILPVIGDRDPQTITWTDIQELVATLAADLKPSSVSRYTATVRQLLDFAGVDPNPARDKRVKLPSIVYEEPDPPTDKQFLAMLDKIPARWRLPLITLEQTAMAVGEAEALVWGDVDVDGLRFRLRRGTVKAGIRARARWVQTPDWLMDAITLTCPLEDRVPGRRVYIGFTADVAKNVMARACKTAKIPHYHPHDLRHRRLSLWHGQGVPARELANRAGHSKPSMSLDVYSHVMPLDEIPEAAFLALLG